MTEEYANVFEVFDESIENHVAWEPGFIPSQTQTIAIPEMQAAGATVTVRFAIVDNDKDGRPVNVDVTVGSQTQSNRDTVPNAKDTLNLYELTFTIVEARVEEVTILLESPDGTGDSAAIIGTAVSYKCHAALSAASITMEKVLNSPAPQEL